MFDFEPEGLEPVFPNEESDDLLAEGIVEVLEQAYDSEGAPPHLVILARLAVEALSMRVMLAEMSGDIAALRHALDSLRKDRGDGDGWKL